MTRIITAIALLLPAFSASAQTAPPQEGPITCTSPVAPDDTEKSLKQRYGKDAVVQEVPGAEGERYKGVVLFPKARDRRIEIAFTDDKAGRASGLTLRDAGRPSLWNVAGVTIGSSLADVQKANGKPFLVSGFEWDYGGFVTDWKGGALGRPMQGGCRMTIRFGGKTGAPKALSGDGVKAASDNAALVKWAPVVTEIGVNFPDK
ncbi:hypothetical protein [Bradyrhizobium tunisiense]|jgi:hypothetical protein|uniref:hypothetical protein n=1 Tax=Bradyrhizobium tunisiense TaxID=3278709 RepID=UPI0035DF8E12